MPQIRKRQNVRFTPEQMFQLVYDFERYPEFLPWCSGALLRSLSEHQLVGTLYIEKGGIKKSFTTRNAFVRPNYMDIELVNGPFKHLRGRWDFRTIEGGCEILYYMDFEVSLLLKPILSGVLELMSHSMVQAFCKRAEVVYAS